MINHYRELKVWQESIDLYDCISTVADSLPQKEYALANQMRRSALSVPSNIAEGSARNSTKELIQFLYIARGSIAELETQIIVTKRRKYIEEQVYNSILARTDRISRMLAGLIASLKNKPPRKKPSSLANHHSPLATYS